MRITWYNIKTLSPKSIPNAITNFFVTECTICESLTGFAVVCTTEQPYKITHLYCDGCGNNLATIVGGNGTILSPVLTM
ncbi:hypothetical protein M5X11_34220 [Paenibacillus alginolyticus]|uniref:hypothetical protein n=1 Tax=Paenibacillus alginolyticus TaxID=59839 RepID=UPI000FDAD26F|nr:hypothetical protein [Paenibacillus alginolyticus]MCY9669910.1 hypothetical protein [Paenibacillus alginolyticus]